MKTLKRLLAVMIVVIMCVSLGSVAAYAAGEGSIIITGTTPGKTYDAYKIFDLTYSGSGADLAVTYTIDTDWAAFFAEGGAGASYIVATNSGDLQAIDVDGTTMYINITERNVAEFAETALDYATTLTPDKTATATGGNATINSVTMRGLDLGYYLVYPRGASNIKDGYASLCSLTSTTPNANVVVKAEYQTVDKKIVEDDHDRVNINEASVGDIITYVATTKCPDTAGYEWYHLAFRDHLDKGLTFIRVASVKITGILPYMGDHIAEVMDVDVGEYSSENGTDVTFDLRNIKAFMELNHIEPGASIEITYLAQLNENAVIDGPNKNTIDLIYSNDPSFTHDHDYTPNGPHGETPEVITKTYTTAVKIIKTDGSTALTGAEFQITGNGVNIVVTTGEVFVLDPDGTYWLLNDGTYTTQDPADLSDTSAYASTTDKYKKETQVALNTQGANAVDAKAFVGPDGTLTFQGLGAGTYTITETVVPAGYNKADDVTFTLSFDPETETFSSNNPAVQIGQTTNLFEVTIVNQSGTQLPNTGGIGTTIFYVVGSLFLLAAVVILNKRRATCKG